MTPGQLGCARNNGKRPKPGGRKVAPSDYRKVIEDMKAGKWGGLNVESW